MPLLPPVLGPDDLPYAELMAAGLDGEVYALGAGHCPVDAIPTPSLRLAAALSGRSGRYIAELGTAAWVWGATPVMPFPFELCVEMRARARPAPTKQATVRELMLRADETCVIGERRVTTPMRTAIDLARVREKFEVADRQVIARLADLGGFTLAECLAAMNGRRNLPAKRRAAERLGRVLGQPPLTRYTS